MAAQIPFVREMDFEVRRRSLQMTPLVRRVIADNPGSFTYTGHRRVYIIGRGTVCVIDPGPMPDKPLSRR